MRNKIIKLLKIINEDRKKYLNCIFLYSSSSILDLIVLFILAPLISILTGDFKENFFLNLQLNETQSIFLLGFIILIITFFKGFFNYKSIYKSIKFSTELQEKNRSKIFSFYKDVYINDISPRKLEKYQNITSYVVGVFSENIIFKSITVISEVTIIFIICIYLSFINFYALLGLASLVSILLTAYFFFIKKFIFLAGITQANSMEKLTESINSVFKGFKEINVLQLSNYFDKKFNISNKEFTKNFINYQKLVFLPKYLLEVVMITFVIFLFFFISYFAEMPIRNYFELIGIFLFATLRITPLAYNIFSSLSQIFSSSYAVDELFEEFEKINQFKKIKSLNTLKKKIIVKSIKKITFDNISFQYSENKKVLEKINVSFNSGECVGIKGDSGSGKTTFVNILLGLLYPNKGKIIINDTYEINNTNIFKKMSYTPQDIFLTKGNIVENIALGQDSVNKTSLIQSVKNAQIINFLDQNQNKIFETLQNTYTHTLSGGQAQRIAIARTLYFKKEISVFDEFTSALDIETEDKIVEHLNTLKKDRFIFIISHRLNALKNCDKIYEIKNNTIDKIK